MALSQTQEQIVTGLLLGDGCFEFDKFKARLTSPPTHPLRPINPDNARGTRITAAAGQFFLYHYKDRTISSPRYFYRGFGV